MKVLNNHTAACLDFNLLNGFTNSLSVFCLRRIFRPVVLTEHLLVKNTLQFELIKAFFGGLNDTYTFLWRK